MTIDELVTNYPRLYHMAETGTWKSIERHGLLSTEALLDLFEIRGKHRQALGAQHRPECVTVCHAVHGTATIRDQKPMKEGVLVKCLDDYLTPQEWYRILNRRVFFWVSRDRLNRLLGARPYRNKQHCVLTLDTAALLEKYSQKVSLCPINSGCTLFDAPRRGLGTFQSIADYPFTQWRKRRGKQDAVVEFVVDYAVPDVVNFVVEVEERKCEKLIATLWKRP